MARDRKRAKQRKARREEQAGAADGTPGQEIFPGPLNPASGEVEEFKAKLAADSGGPLEPGEVLAEPEVATDGLEDVEELSDEEFEELEDAVDDVEEAFEDGDPDAIEEAEGELDEEVVAQRRDRAAGAPVPTKKGGLRFVSFLKASWAELQRVQWPDRRQVGQATAVVLGFVVVAGLYLGAADWVADKIVDLII